MEISKRTLSLSIVLSLSMVSGCVSTGSDYTPEGSYTKSSSDNNIKRNYSFPSQMASTGQKEFIFDPAHLMWAAYNANGSLVNQGAASGGQNYCPDIHSPCRTPVGTFHVIHKQGEDCKSHIFPIGKGGSPMPYCMFFGGGYAVHGSYEVPDYNASHGCIRLPPPDAEWLLNNFMDIGTTVKVLPYSS